MLIYMCIGVEEQLKSKYKHDFYTSLQRYNTENWKQIFPEKELHGHNHNFYIHVSVSDLYIPTIDLHTVGAESLCRNTCISYFRHLTF